MDVTDGKGNGDPIRITVQLNRSVIGADPSKLGEELARLVEAPLAATVRRRMVEASVAYVDDALARIARLGRE